MGIGWDGGGVVVSIDVFIFGVGSIGVGGISWGMRNGFGVGGFVGVWLDREIDLGLVVIEVNLGVVVIVVVIVCVVIIVLVV